jgi:hypothetical protein
MQPSFWHRLPPPCAMQYSVSPKGRLQAALVLAALAPAMRLALLRAAISSLDTALVLTPPAPAVRSAIARVASS